MSQVCTYCQEPSEMEWEAPDEPHHGEEAICEECGAEYYREYEGKVYAANDKAKQAHPNLKSI